MHMHIYIYTCVCVAQTLDIKPDCFARTSNRSNTALTVHSVGRGALA